VLAFFIGAIPGGYHLNTVAIQIGSTVEGTVVKLADYGIIVRLAGGKVGLVHISEVADTYVRDVHDYFKENDRVCVKVLKINDKGRYELSVKQADEKNVVASHEAPSRSRHQEAYEHVPRDPRYTAERPQTFEDRLSRFMKDSEERIHDLKRSVDEKRGGGKRR
jgi:S1 RNA binding domain protein